MSSGTSSVTIIVGNLGADPELKYMPNGEAVLNLSVATSISWKNKSSGEIRSETEWHRCVLFRTMAENAAKYLTKGSKVYIQGRNRTRKWQDSQNLDHYTTEVMVRDIQYLDKAPESSAEAKVTNAHEAAAQIPDANNYDTFDDDIPF